MIAHTPYSNGNQQFSDRAHELAQAAIYPKLFGVDPACLTFDDVTGMTQERNRILDGEMAVDKIVNVSVRGLGAPLVFTVQERFRRISAERFRDITITEWNCNSNRPSELYKIKAGLFLYGYYNDTTDRFIGQSLVVNMPALLIRIAANRIYHERAVNPRSNQRFITIPFESLDELGIIEYRCFW